MTFLWNESMATGIPDLDNQHQELFRQVARLHDAMKKGEGRAEIETILDSLADYALLHFAAEESQMDLARCPAAAANRQAHNRFLEQLKAFRQRFDEEGAGTTLVLELSDFVLKWLVDHISRIDTQLNACAAAP